jgi:hypothetical protein
MELKSYFIMAYEHFYLGNPEKFKFYMIRYERGICEDENSILRRMFENAEKSQEKQLSVSVFETSHHSQPKSMMKLPSPSQVANTSGEKAKFNFDDPTGKYQNII